MLELKLSHLKFHWVESLIGIDNLRLMDKWIIGYLKLRWPISVLEISCFRYDCGWSRH